MIGFNNAPLWCAVDCRHDEPRTVEDVLWDALCEYDKGELSTREVAITYAAEIRELMGGAE